MTPGAPLGAPLGVIPALSGGALTVWSGWLILAAALAGVLLAGLHFRPQGPPSFAGAAGVAHGLVGAAGLAALLFALGRPDAARPPGTDAFRRFAVVLLGLALLGGAAVGLAGRRRKRLSPGLVGVHASLAIAGLAVLAAALLAG